MGKSASAAAISALAILSALCSLPSTDAALRIHNALDEGNVTVSALPGCCSSCVPTKGRVCPQVCQKCPTVTVASGKVATVNRRVGPYPLQYLNVHVLGKGYEVQQGDKFTSTASFVVGPGTQCGSRKNGVEAFIVEGSNVVTASMCLSY